MRWLSIGVLVCPVVDQWGVWLLMQHLKHPGLLPGVLWYRKDRQRKISAFFRASEPILHIQEDGRLLVLRPETSRVMRLTLYQAC